MVEEKQAFREFLKERERARDAAQVEMVSPDRNTEAPAGNEGDVVEGGVVKGGVVEGGLNGDSVIIGSTEPTTET